jgi:uncharacterized protein (DUF305 family)
VVEPRRRAIRLMTTRLLSATLLAGAATLAVVSDITPAEAAASPSVASEQPFLQENDAAMSKMMANMTIKPTGDIDKDFVAMMVPHHQGAIDMAEAELRYGHNELLQRISQEIIAEQLQEIAAMRVAVGEHVSPYQAMLAASTTSSPARVDPKSSSAMVTQKDSLRSETPFLAENATAMNKMMADMSVKPTGNIDRDFVAMMIPHHQGAIDMARAELRYGHSSQLRTIAQEIIVDQMYEITMMRLAVGEALPPSAASPTTVPQVPHSPTSTASQSTSVQMSSNQTNMK